MSDPRSNTDGGFAAQQPEDASRLAPADARGHMHRPKRQMTDGDAKAFLRTQKVAHVGTVDSHGWPYVVPLIYIYEGSDRLYVHSGITTATFSKTCALIHKHASRSRTWDPCTEGVSCTPA